MNNVLNLKTNIEDKNFIDKLADFLNDVKKNKKQAGFFLWFDEEGFCFDWYGDCFRLVGSIEYAKCVISSHIMEEFSDEGKI